MVIKLVTTTDFQGSDDLLKALGNIQATSKLALQGALAKHQGELDTIFNDIPPPRNGAPILPNWTSPEQRKYVMGYVLKGTDGKYQQYQRTGATQQGFFARVIDGANGAEMEIGNTNPLSRFVVGTFAERQDFKGRGNQQIFHRAWGWQPIGVRVREVTEKIILAYRSDVVGRFSASSRASAPKVPKTIQR